MKIRGIYACAVLISVLLPIAANAKDKEQPPTAAELAEITQRGKLIAEYDQIAWHATDLVQAQHPEPGKVQGWVIEKQGDDWLIVFGRLNEVRDELEIAYQVTTKPGMAESGVLNPKPNQTDKGLLFREFLAMDNARTDFGNPGRPYNDAVLPGPNGQFYVYFYPAQTDNNVFPMGGDVRYLISADGKTILEKRQLHKTILETQAPPAGAKPAAGFHTHFLDNVPGDTDVAYVLMRRPSVPEYIATPEFFYEIDANGTIKYVGETKKVLKGK